MNERPYRAVLFLTVSLAWMSLPPQARGTDTMEPFELGLSNADFHIGVDGLPGHQEELAVSSEVMLGYGILDRFSGYLGITLRGNGYMVEGSSGLYLGLMATPLETRHLDFDVYLTLGTGEAGSNHLHWTPGLEINVDLDPDMEGLGFYLRTEVPVAGVEGQVTSDLANSSIDFADGPLTPEVSLETTFGTYFRWKDVHEVVLEPMVALRSRDSSATAVIGPYGLALGYNVLMNPTLEALFQIDLQRAGPSNEAGGFSAGFFAGFIATLP